MPLRVRLCPVGDVVAGKLQAYTVTGVTWPVMVTRVDDAIVAFPGVCPHDDVSLVDYGKLENGEVVCRVHGYRFDVASGYCEAAPWIHLRRYKVTITDDVVFVDLL